MTSKMLLALAIIAAVAVASWFIALQFEAAAWVLSAIGISAVIAAIGVVATEMKRASLKHRQ
jgi:hypothetical protein